jgi:hypothetical protein
MFNKFLKKNQWYEITTVQHEHVRNIYEGRFEGIEKIGDVTFLKVRSVETLKIELIAVPKITAIASYSPQDIDQEKAKV